VEEKCVNCETYLDEPQKCTDCKKYRVVEMPIESITIKKPYYVFNDDFEYEDDDFGKTIFFTLGEAEAAI
jgi:hypothetical protein